MSGQYRQRFNYRPLTDRVRLSVSEGLTVSCEAGDHRYSLFRDGLALLGNLFRDRLREVVIWSPNDVLSLRWAASFQDDIEGRNGRRKARRWGKWDCRSRRA